MAKCISGELTGSLDKLATDFSEFAKNLDEVNFPTEKLTSFTSSLTSLGTVLDTVKTNTDGAVESLKNLSKILNKIGTSSLAGGTGGGVGGGTGGGVVSKNALTNDSDRYYREFKSNIVEGSLNSQTDNTIKAFLTDPNISPATRNNWVGAISKLGVNAPSLLNQVNEYAQSIDSPTNKAVLFREIAKANYKTGQELLDPTSGIYQSVMGNVGKMGSDPSNANKYLEEIANAIAGKNSENPAMSGANSVAMVGAVAAGSIATMGAQIFSNFVTNRPQNALQYGQATESTYSTVGKVAGGVLGGILTAGAVALAAPTGGLSLAGLAAVAAGGAGGAAALGAGADYMGRLGSQSDLMNAMYHGKAGADPFGGNTGIMPTDVYEQYGAMGMTLDSKYRREFMNKINSADGMNLSRTKFGAFGDYGMTATDETIATLSLGKANRVGANFTGEALAKLTDSSGLGLTLGQVESTASLLSATSRFRTGDSVGMVEQYSKYSRVQGAAQAFVQQEGSDYTGKIVGNEVSKAIFGKNLEGVLDDISSGDKDKREKLMSSLKRATGATNDTDAIDIGNMITKGIPQLQSALQGLGGKAGKDPTELLASMEKYLKELVDLTKEKEVKEVKVGYSATGKLIGSPTYPLGSN